jgi:hypothetical protein
LYDAANDAFLVQRVRLEGLPGSAGQSTGLALSIGRLITVIDHSTIASPLPVHFGLGTQTVMNTHRLATDGTTHATIAVAAGSPGALFAAVAAPPSDRVTVSDGMRTRVERADRARDHVLASVSARSSEFTSSTGAKPSLRAVRRAFDSRALDLAISVSAAPSASCWFE